MTMSEIQDEIAKLEEERFQLDLKDEWEWEDERRAIYISRKIRQYYTIINGGGYYGRH